MRAITTGDLPGALALNPMFFAAFAGGVIYDAYAATVLVLRLPRLRLEEVPSWLGWSVRIGALAAVVGNWAWLIVDGR